MPNGKPPLDGDGETATGQTPAPWW